MVKQIGVCLMVMVLITMIGCSSAPKKIVSIIKLDDDKDISINVIEIEKVIGPNGVFITVDGGLKITVKNETSEVKYINWSASSLCFEGITSRIITGSDKPMNINNIVPNTALMPSREFTTTIYAADTLHYNPGDGKWISPYYYTDTPIKNNVSILISYSGKDTTILKQAMYDIVLEETLKKTSK